MSNSDPVDLQALMPDVIGALTKVHGALAAHKPDAMLEHLVQLRASQINGCGFCVKMHTGDARKDGETNERLDRLIVWRHVSDFSPAERAAFAWTEALTDLAGGHDLPALRAELRAHFSDEQIAVLTANIAMINLWNRIQISTH